MMSRNYLGRKLCWKGRPFWWLRITTLAILRCKTWVAPQACTRVITVLKAWFSRHGIPVTVFSDNGLPFNSEDFKIFSKEWDFHHVTSSPYHAQSNGRVEKAVKTCKSLLIKARADKRDPSFALLERQNTPSESMDALPVQLLYGRQTNMKGGHRRVSGHGSSQMFWLKILYWCIRYQVREPALFLRFLTREASMPGGKGLPYKNDGVLVVPFRVLNQEMTGAVCDSADF